MAKIIQIGMGPIALKFSRFVFDSKLHEIIGCYDIRKDIVGKSLKELSNIDLDIEVAHFVDFNGENADLAVVTTVSSLEQLYPLLKTLIENKINVLSTCEELFFPFETNPELAQKIKLMAEENNVCVIGTGVNPGFLMDTLPLLLSCTQKNIDHILIERIQDASARRIQFQNKIGYGLIKKDFLELVEQKKIRHVGLRESHDFLNYYLGLKANEVKETIGPVLDGEKVLGVIQTITSSLNGEEKLKYIFKASVGEEEARDRIVISGTPGLEMIIPEALHGDEATCSVLLNCINSILQAPKGLITMAQLQIPYLKNL